MVQKNIAYKARVVDLINARIIKKQGWDLSYFEFNEIRVFRINVMGLVVNLEDRNFVLDDGTGSIKIKSVKNLPKLKIGSLVNVIGTLRDLENSSNFIVSDIVKELDDRLWLKVRKQELKDVKKIEAQDKPILEKIVKKSETKIENLIELIKEMDEGSGVYIEEIVQKSQISDCENKIQKLILEGELFEIKKGKIKVLD